MPVLSDLSPFILSGSLSHGWPHPIPVSPLGNLEMCSSSLLGDSKSVTSSMKTDQHGEEGEKFRRGRLGFRLCTWDCLCMVEYGSEAKGHCR